MKVSIIASVYNSEEYLREMLDSIICQTYHDWEFIIIDDASTDNTWHILQENTDPRIHCYRNKVNKGLTANLNVALGYAKGEYIARMDGDDIAHENRLEKQVCFMDQHPEIVLAGCWIKCFGNSHELIKTPVDDKDIRIALLFNSAIMHPTFIFRRKTVLENGVLYNEKLRYAQDYNFTYRCSKIGRLGNVPEALLRYRVDDNQISVAKRDIQRRCADISRKEILNDMGINLVQTDFTIWSAMCMGNRRFVKKHQQELFSIIQKILNANKRLVSYNQIDLERVMEARVSRCISSEGKNTVATDKYFRLFTLMTQWMKKKQMGKQVGGWLEKRGFKHIAIYGMGDVGECLALELSDSNIEVDYGIDQNAEIQSCLDKIYSLDTELPAVDAIIVTPVTSFVKIRALLMLKTKAIILSIEDVIDAI